MDGRIDVDPRLPPVTLPGRLLNEICSHARETFPEECCGLLTGDSRERFRSAYRCRNDMSLLHERDPAVYPRDAREAFHMNEADYLRVMERARDVGEAVSGVYHSHVGAGAYFSELDQGYASQDLFPFPRADHVVISIVDRKVKELAAFRWNASQQCFEGRPVVAGAP